ncbi:3-ketodihydrosphingosine reductase-like [Actinia tenebrosa]|uniref:3-dehydrosphinganine reductase n=1 Tax=Actinia tenebrosa TaxID=6105 RepID=A0A6P8IBM6_ACTTE|nr:3-ketodihydrosphingosine reductase-like [Actinia tenebrosa]
MFLEVLIGIASFLTLIYALDLFNRKSTNFNGKHTVITGGSSGIGKALAIELAKVGANITLLARNEERLAKAKAEIEKHLLEGRKVQTFSVDLSSDIKQVEKAFDEVYSTFGPVDVLFNCAGYATCGVFEETNIEDFKNMMNTNYFGSVYPTYVTIKNMKQRKQGHIVFVSSMGGQLGIFGLTAYSASKFAVRGFAESLFMEVKPYNIGVSVVFPPDTDTPGFENENKLKPEETKLICSSGGLFSPESVAKNIISGVESRKFLISCGLDGWALNAVTSGAAPPSSWMELITQVTVMGVLRIVMAFTSISHDKIAKEGRTKREGS